MRRFLILLPLLVASGPLAAAEPAADVCVDVRIGGDWTSRLACLNAALRGQVAVARRREEQADAASLGAGADPTRLGLFNEAATAERLGDAFGHSVIPQRPDDQYATPLARLH